MTRLLVHVEGQTEETFVNELLAPHLYANGYERVSARLLGNARQRSGRGGARAWPAVRADIVRHLRGDVGALSTTFVDFYALPQSGEHAWPGRKSASGASLQMRSQLVQQAMERDIAAHLGVAGRADRFVAYVTLHEFEGLLFSDPAAFSAAVGRPELSAAFAAIRQRYVSPEEINDSPQTAPSKQVLRLFPAYDKPLMGTLAALEIGLVRLRAECPRFNAWICSLEAWGRTTVTPG